MRSDEYQKFIDENYPTYEKCYGACHEASARMKELFPELRIVKGWVFCAWGQRDHVWLETEDGQKVDPTARQFTGITEYKEWKPGDEVIVGRCMNCGWDIWESVQSLKGERKDICSKECEKEFIADLMRDCPGWAPVGRSRTARDTR